MEVVHLVAGEMLPALVAAATAGEAACEELAVSGHRERWLRDVCAVGEGCGGGMPRWDAARKERHRMR